MKMKRQRIALARITGHAEEIKGKQYTYIRALSASPIHAPGHGPLRHGLPVVLWPPGKTISSWLSDWTASISYSPSGVNVKWERGKVARPSSESPKRHPSYSN